MTSTNRKITKKEQEEYIAANLSAAQVAKMKGKNEDEEKCAKDV